MWALFKGKTKQETLWKITTISKQRCSHSSLQCSNWVLNSRDLRVPRHVKKTEVSLRNRTFLPSWALLSGQKLKQITFIRHHNTWNQAEVHLQKKFLRKSTREMWSLVSTMEGLDLARHPQISTVQNSVGALEGRMWTSLLWDGCDFPKSFLFCFSFEKPQEKLSDWFQDS